LPAPTTARKMSRAFGERRPTWVRLTFAIALRRLRVRVAVFEQAPELDEIGATVALSANGTRLLRRLGVDEALASQDARSDRARSVKNR
jgi:2-polyprenyl-6-methoxyphenol hydroxylase-like FAD-dependent oxidoreductase